MDWSRMVTAEARQARRAEELREAVNAERERRLTSGAPIPVDGLAEPVLVQGRVEDRINLAALRDMALEALPDAPMWFRDAEDRTVEMTAAQLIQMTDRARAKALAIYAAAHALKDAPEPPEDFAADRHWP